MQPVNNDDRQREFQRQKERLKLMTSETERKPVSADAMIESLMQNVGTFKKISADTPEYPYWLTPNTPSSCQQYEQIWNYLQGSGSYADTTKTSQLLLTSKLHPDVLGFIWSLANKTSPGQLTKQELFIVLALVGLAQSSIPFRDLSILHHLPNPPIPGLRIPTNTFIPVKPEDDFQDFQTATTTPSITIEDDFTDFQSALPSMEIPSPSQIKVSPESERRLKTLSQPESLANLPESKISTQNTVSSLPSIGVLGGNRNLVGKKSKTRKITPPCVTPIPSNELFPKCLQTKFILKETRIPSGEMTPEPHLSTNNLLSLDDNGDKYSALRELTAVESQKEPQVENDEFSDFFSATVEEKEAKAWSVWNSSIGTHTETPLVVGPTKETNVDILMSDFESPNIIQVDGGDDFGDFSSPVYYPNETQEQNSTDLNIISQSISSDVPVLGLSELTLDPPDIPTRCIRCCKQLLQTAVGMLQTLSKDVLDEVFTTTEARNYIKYLYIVYQIAQRVSKVVDSCGFNEIQGLWNTLNGFSTDFNIGLVSDLEIHDQMGSPCGVCNSLTVEGDILENGTCFHTSCANLWVNCIDTALPCS